MSTPAPSAVSTVVADEDLSEYTDEEEGEDCVNLVKMPERFASFSLDNAASTSSKTFISGLNRTAPSVPLAFIESPHATGAFSAGAPSHIPPLLRVNTGSQETRTLAPLHTSSAKSGEIAPPVSSPSCGSSAYSVKLGEIGSDTLPVPGGHALESTFGTKTKMGPALTQMFEDQLEDAKIDSAEDASDVAETSFQTVNHHQTKRASTPKANQHQSERIISSKTSQHQPKKISPSSSAGRENKKRDSTPSNSLKSAIPRSISVTKKQRRTEVSRQ